MLMRLTKIQKEYPLFCPLALEMAFHQYNAILRTFSNDPFMLSSLIYIDIYLLYHNTIHSFNKIKMLESDCFYLRIDFACK